MNLECVMKKFFRDHLPSHDTIMQSRWVRPFGTWLRHPNLWHLHRRSVAGGVAVGLFCGLIPGPLQMVGAAVMAVLFRVNLPVAMFTTLYTNPLTILPLYVLAYEYGALLIGHSGSVSPAHLNLPEITWVNWLTVLPHWFASLGKPFAIGLPLLGFNLAVIGYLTVRVLWYWMVVWEWRRRAVRRAQRMEDES